MSVLQPGKMIYNNFGNSGLKVSAISLGNMINFQAKNYEEDRKIIEVALKNGINHFDTAELYGAGEAEIALGKILKDLKVPREEVVIATKVHTAKDPERNSGATTNKKHIRESITKSLARLQMDYVDILYAHFHDHATPVEEICRGFHEVIEAGQAFYWATSNWEPEVVYEAFAVCERLNLHKPIGAQNQYSMLVRADTEVEHALLFSKHNYGLIAWSPLAGGFLTGKYLNGIPEGDNTRITDNSLGFPLELIKQLFYDDYATEKTINKLKELSTIAEKEGFKLSHLAVAWCLKYKHLNSALIGARNAAQLEDTLKALDLLEKLTPEFEAQVNKVLDTTPTPRTNFIKWAPYPPARPVAQ
jgi:voltage-dependent potassium channel beta subunit